MSDREARNSEPRPALLAVFLLAVAVLSFPNLRVDLHELFWIDGWGPDASLFVALHVAARDGLVFGRDLVFTYGPLGYLTFAIDLGEPSWIQAVAYQLFAHGLLFVSLYAFLRRQGAGWRGTFWIGGVVTVFLHAIGGWLVDLKLAVALVALSHMRLTTTSPAAYRDALLGVLAAPLVYVKFSGGITALLIVVACAALLGWQRRPLRAAALLSGYLAASLAIGLWVLGSPDALGDFLRHSLEIAGSYVDAVGVTGPGWQLALGLLAGAGCAVLLALDLAHGRIDRSLLCVSGGLLFAGFKHGFVRHDAHVAGFFAIWMMVTALDAVSKERRGRGQRGAVALSALLLLVSGSMTFLNGDDVFFHRILTSISVGPGNVPRFLHALGERRTPASTGAESHRVWLKDELSRVPDSDLAEETRRAIDTHTVDVFPWEVALLERHGLRWHPRPVFQSYAAFSAALDASNASHFRGGEAPEFVLYALDSIDGRYPPFDEPETFRVLLTHYEVVHRDHAYLLLRRRDGARYEERPIATVRAALGEEVRVPFSETGWVFARVRLGYSVWGRIARLVYKPPPLYVRLVSRGMALKYRFVAPTAANGIFLSRYVLGPRDLLSTWEGELSRNLDTLTIETERSGFFAPPVELEFFEVPSHLTVRDDWKVACGPGDEIVRGGGYSIDVVQGEHVHELRQPIAVDPGQPLEISGWAVDKLSGEVAGDVFLEIDGRLLAPADYGRWRQDVAELLGEDAYAYSGWRANLDLEGVPPGTHRLTLRIVSKDGRRCYQPAKGIAIHVEE